MAKIAKKMQPKHKETLSPWLQSFVASTVSTPLPLLPQTFETFPSKWPFPRGDLFHWIPLLNRFDNILECFVGNYNLDKGPQTQDFSCDLLLGKCSAIEYGGEGQHWDEETLRSHGFGSDGDRQLLEAVLGFTRMLLDNCGNRSIYSSSAHLNHLLNTTSMSLLQATLSVGSELARRYQASLKRLGRNQPQQQVTAALLANHYNISLDAVHQLAMPFVRTPIISLSESFPSSTPGSASKSKDRPQQAHSAKNAASMHANDLVSIAASDAGSWKGWGDVKIFYYPHSSQTDAKAGRRSGQSVTSTPATPTPLRRSSTMNSPTPKSSSRGGATAEDGSPTTSRTPGLPSDSSTHSPQKTFELTESKINSTPIHALVAQFPSDLPEPSKYELLHRIRIAKALVGSPEDRQRALSVRLLAILNLINIHPEAVFVEKVLRHDIDETRRFQLAYQLADLIHPTADGAVPVPIPVQSIALSLLEALSGLQCRFGDVVSALNATVNHGILLYVMRTAVAGMKEDTSPDTDQRLTETDEWRGNLFSLASQITANPNMKIGGEMLSSGLMDVLVEILGLRSSVAMRHHHAILLFLDTLIWTYSHGLEAFFNSNGLDEVAKLTVTTVQESCQLTDTGRGTPPDHHTSAVDYDIPFYHHQTLKSVLRFIHYIMSNWYSHGGNADRLLRNLADKTDLLHSLRTVIEGAKRFGPSPWTSASSILSDFINNDPTSFAAISESGLITSFLTAVTGRPVPSVQQETPAENADENTAEGNESDQSPEQSGAPVAPDVDDRPHPPTAEMLSGPRPREVAASILASFDAVSTIPIVLNAICLNNSGLRTVIASGVFESYFEIFESPRHVRCMDGDYNPASSLGRHFDELARHHPALRMPMSNAAIDAVARVVHLGKNDARVAEWGVKLQVLDSAQNPVQADSEVTKRLAQGESGPSGQLQRAADDSDVEMADRGEEEDKNGEADDTADKENRIPPFEPFVYVLCNFLTTYLSNSSLKISFVNKGGIELLLDIVESPSLTHTFGEHLASRTIQHVISGLVEHNPVLALPSVLRRTQAAIDSLSPLANEANGEAAFFAPFLEADLSVSPKDAAAWSPEKVSRVEQGSDVARALLNAQTLIKTLCDCFAPSPRSNNLSLHPVNVYDYYIALINSLGPLLRASLLEESAHHGLVPRHWLSNRRPFASADDREPTSNAPPATGPDAPEATDAAAPSGNAEGTLDQPPESGGASQEPTLQPAEKKTVRYKNFDTLRLLLHSMMPTAYPLFQSLGKALLPRRDRDKFSRSKHMAIAMALADSVLNHLEASVNASEEATPKDYHYWIIMMHTIHEMLVDTSRPSERSPQLLMPVLLAFKERGGFTVLNTMLRSFMRQIGVDNAAGSSDSTKAKVASFGMRKILDLYVLVVNGKYVSDSTGQFNLPPRAERPPRDSTFANSLVVELRLLVLPVIDELWQSDLVENVSDQTIVSVVDILNLISSADQEPQNGQRVVKSTTAIFSPKREPYDWSNARYDVTRLVEAGYDENLAAEALFRSNANYHYASEYCRAHKSGIAGARNPVPADDAYSPAEPEASTSQGPGTDNAESMAIDSAGEGDPAARDDAHADSAEEDDDESSQATEENHDTPPAAPEAQANGGAGAQDASGNGEVKDEPDLRTELDELRSHLREGLIDKSLDVLRSHPTSAIDISDLIRTMVFRQKPSDEVREEVGATLANALSSLAMDDEEKAANGRSIASYSHLLALLLQDKHFFLCNIDTLKEKVDEYLGFLKIPSSSSNDELPPWIPFILLVLETLLQHDERPQEYKWDAPTSEDDPVVAPTLTPRKTMVPENTRMELLENVLEILPRIGKDEALATAILRVLVILTRHRSAAQQLGERKNLQRLFVMVKQLSVLGAESLKSSKINSWIMVILRHIVEDEETTAQIIKAEIQSQMSGSGVNRPQRRMDGHTYIQNLASTAIRAPETFVDVSANVVKIDQWVPSDPLSSRSPSTLVLKETPGASSETSETADVDQGDRKNDSSAQTGSEDVKESTETGDKEMTDAPKESKWPVVENPDGVVHFLLCELLNYKEVDDKDTAAPAMKELKPQDSSSPTPERSDSSPATPEEPSTAESSDKKIQKPVFKPEEHPIFVYRSFLLNSLAELIQSYNRTKMEFLSFKRSVPPQLGSTPVRPRSSIVNYLIDLLCQDSLNATTDTVASKKKTATATRASSVLVALVTRSGEMVYDRTRDRFEYDDDPDLLFVRKFVLDTILKAFEKAATPDESLDARYARMQSLAELMCHIIGDKEKDHPSTHRSDMLNAQVHAQLRRMMYEKGYIEKLTTSIAEIDLKYPGVKRVIKYILRVLRILTDTAKDLSLTSNVIPTSSLPEYVEDEIASASSLSDLEDEREETPDLYRHSALGMLEPRDSDDESEDDEDDEDDGYGDEDEYGDEMDYDDEGLSSHEDDNVSDEDEEIGEMGPIEGLHGDPVLEVIVGDEHDMDEDDDEEDTSEESDDEDEDMGSDEFEDEEDRVEIAVEENDLMEDDGNPEWESATDSDEDDDALGFDEEVDDDELHHHHHHHHHHGHLSDGEILGNITRAVIGAETDFDPDDVDDLGEAYMDDGHEDDEDEDEEDLDDDEYPYDEDYPHPAPAMMPPALGWDTLMVDPPQGHLAANAQANRRHRHRGNVFGQGWTLAPTPRDFPDYRGGLLHRSNAGRMNQGGATADDGTNPLLRRPTAGRDASPRPGGPPGSFAVRLHSDLMGGGPDRQFGGPIAILHDLIAAIPQVSHVTWASGTGGPPVPIFGDHRRDPRDILPSYRDSRSGGQRDGGHTDPNHAVAFSPVSTRQRHDEEATMLFGSRFVDRCQSLLPQILYRLVPAAIEKKKEEDAEKAKRKEERLKREAEEARLKKEEEDRKAEEARQEEARLAAEAAEAAGAARAAEVEAQNQQAQEEPDTATAPSTGDDNAPGSDSGTQPMEGVETTEAPEPAAGTSAEASSQERVLTTIRGEEVDVTELGIDPDYLAALPEEFREEVIAQTVSSRRSQARDENAPRGEQQTEVFQEFLDALPAELRVEIIQQERQEQRRRNDEEQRRQVQTSGVVPVPAEMDAASILLTLPPELRDEVLLEQGDDILDQLPPDMAAQARALAERHQPRHTIVRGSNIVPSTTARLPGRAPAPEGTPAEKAARRTVIQMLDKSGVATLLRLMFIALQGHTRSYLFGVFSDICENKQNRLEVISTLLQILQDGSTDMDAIERSFGHLSLKAKRPKDKESDTRTPQSIKRSLTTLSGTPGNAPTQTYAEISPLLIVQQCLDLLVDLLAKNPHISYLFLTEHDIVGSSIKRLSSRKGKAKDTKAQKYAINSLLSLLDRELVMESSNIMGLLADLLNRLTLPLQNLERRRREAEEAAKKAEEEKAAAEKAAAEEKKEGEEEESSSAPPAAPAESPTEGDDSAKPAEGEASTEQDKKQGGAAEKSKARSMQMPVIPHYNLTLVIKVFVARECSSKTFQNTIAAIKNLSVIPEAKAVFGQELVKQAQLLSQNIVSDLDELLPQITKASSGTEIQGVALAKFSPGASEQNKLLRVLTALDHLFEPKKAEPEDEHRAATRETEKQDLISSLYHHPTFLTMWEKLSACLAAIRQRENMLNVATILLPLIESLMAICKNAATNDEPERRESQGKEMVLTSPPPESPMAGLFFTFTEEHRRILNDLVRNNPKLMQGPFKLLVKNPKVLEFDNKRNYFNRSVHARGQGRASYQPLQLSVRREHVFHDSFKSLYFKSGDEMKYGKLNIRFHGEEGVDAGGVTREWFQVLSRQMFNPNYALFIPVSSDRTTFHPNKLSGINDEHLRFFKFIGRVIGKALYEGRVLDCYFSRAVYKRILGKSVSVKDMESFDPDYYKSLVWMLDNDITDIITETFSVEDDEFGKITVVDLVPNGRNIPVTEDNKHDYVRLVVEHKLLSSVKDQMEHFLTGFHDVIPAGLISIFNEQELELLISGLPDIDVDDWKGNTEYHNYTASSPQIQWFWRAVRSFDKEERAKLLQFVTGTSKVPLNGFKELEGMNGVNRFNIHRDYGNKTRLPSSHTCFNQLDLPEYENYDMLRRQVMKAITAGSEYFGFA